MIIFQVYVAGKPTKGIADTLEMAQKVALKNYDNGQSLLEIMQLELNEPAAGGTPVPAINWRYNRDSSEWEQTNFLEDG